MVYAPARSIIPSLKLARGLSLRTGSQTMLYLSLSIQHRNGAAVYFGRLFHGVEMGRRAVEWEVGRLVERWYKQNCRRGCWCSMKR